MGLIISALKRSNSGFVSGVLSVFLLFLTLLPSQAVTKYSATVYGYWFDPASWAPVGIPTAGDSIVIRSSDYIIVDRVVTHTSNPIRLVIQGSLGIEGYMSKLILPTGSDIWITEQASVISVDAEYGQGVWAGNHELLTFNGSTFVTGALYISANPGLSTWIIQVQATEQAQTSNRLEWIALFEASNQGFIIQRSIDGGESYANIGFVNGIGQNPGARSFTFTDNHAPQGVTVSYQIVPLSFNGVQGSPSTAPVIEKKAVEQVVKAHPCPFTNELSVEIPKEVNGAITLNVYDMNGRLVLLHPVRNALTTETISTEMLQPGIYTIELSDGFQSIAKNKIFKL